MYDITFVGNSTAPSSFGFIFEGVTSGNFSSFHCEQAMTCYQVGDANAAVTGGVFRRLECGPQGAGTTTCVDTNSSDTHVIFLGIENLVSSTNSLVDNVLGKTITAALIGMYQTMPSSGNVPPEVLSGTATMTTAAITAGSCGTTVTVAAAGVLTTDSISFSFNAAPAGSNADLVAWLTTNNVKLCILPELGRDTGCGNHQLASNSLKPWLYKSQCDLALFLPASLQTRKSFPRSCDVLI
jgi:hypothetical protein